MFVSTILVSINLALFRFNFSYLSGCRDYGQNHGLAVEIPGKVKDVQWENIKAFQLIRIFYYVSTEVTLSNYSFFYKYRKLQSYYK